MFEQIGRKDFDTENGDHTKPQQDLRVVHSSAPRIGNRRRHLDCFPKRELIQKLKSLQAPFATRKELLQTGTPDRLPPATSPPRTGESRKEPASQMLKCIRFSMIDRTGRRKIASPA